MGLDVVIYRRDGIKDIFEISENLHSAIFSQPIWTNYQYIKHLKDYYKTNTTFVNNDIDRFIEQILDFRRNLEGDYLKEFNDLIGILTKEDNISRIHIAGD